VTGNNSEQRLVSSKQSKPQRNLLPGQRSLLTVSGFTLLELMIVISVIIILASVALPQYQKTIMHAREAVLRDDLFRLRSLIDQYSADKGKLPQSLDDLVTAGYMREVPEDPITGNKDWQITMGDDPSSTESAQGMINIHSAATEPSTTGTPYSEW
jgi:general secretion pathway protein G